jgi:hypothetical protein
MIFAMTPEELLTRHAARIALGLSGFVIKDPEPEPSNVHSLEAGRTRRATREMLRRRGSFREERF